MSQERKTRRELRESLHANRRAMRRMNDNQVALARMLAESREEIGRLRAALHEIIAIPIPHQMEAAIKGHSQARDTAFRALRDIPGAAADPEAAE